VDAELTSKRGGPKDESSGERRRGFGLPYVQRSHDGGENEKRKEYPRAAAHSANETSGKNMKTGHSESAEKKRTW